MRFPWPRPRHRLAIVTHHKVGTVLMSNVFRHMSSVLGWSSESVLGHREARNPMADVTLFGHGVPAQLPGDPDLRVVHLVRDPREVLVSGYLYHLHTDEPWCVEIPPSTPPETIGFPLVPYSQESRDRVWKLDYLTSLRGRSYRDNLNRMDTTSGLQFELDHYARWTIEEMLRWTDAQDKRVLMVRFEDIMGSFDTCFDRIGRHLGLRTPERWLLQILARRQDLDRKSADEVRAMAHVHDPTPDRWKQYLTDDLTERIETRFDTGIRALGYGRDAKKGR
jgi:hypothetical protein